MKKMLALFALSAASAAFAAKPEISNVTLTQDARRQVVVGYTLAHAPAIVTVDLFTNGVSIGRLVKTVSGDGNRLVEADGAHTFTWRARKDWKDVVLRNELQAKVTAYHPANPPDYVAMNLADGADPAVNYYAAGDSLPGGIESDVWRTTRLLVKKCPVKYRTYQSGVPFGVKDVGRGEENYPHEVTFTNDYYMGVFELTHAQYEAVKGGRHRDWRFMSLTNANWKVRPVPYVSMSEIRESGDECDDLGVAYASDAYRYPHSPGPNSFFGRLHAKTGLRCDVPSYDQWNVMAHCGGLYGFYGQPVTNTEDCAIAREIGRYKYNGGNYNFNGTYVAPGDKYNGVATPGAGISLDYGTARVGSYRANDWGFYDVFGNVGELTLNEKHGKGAKFLYDPYGEAYYDNTRSRTGGSMPGYMICGSNWNSGCSYGVTSGGTAGLYSNNQHVGVRVMYRVNQTGFYNDL